jgi:hypothetical protein
MDSVARPPERFKHESLERYIYQIWTNGALVVIESTAPPIFGTTDLEREIEQEFRKLPPAVRPPNLAIPDYVEHRDGATEIGKLSAEAVVREYEAAAKDIETMGAELIERVRQCEAMTRGALAVTEEMKQTAARYREEAKRVFLEIENCSVVTAEVRKTCNELIEKIVGPVSIDRPKPSRSSRKP